MSTPRRPWPLIPAPFAVPVGAALLLCVGATASALHGRMSGAVVAVLCGVVVLSVGVASNPSTAFALAAIAWMTAASFARPPYGRLQPTPRQAELAAAAVGVSLAMSLSVQFVRRLLEHRQAGVTLGGVNRLSGFVAAVDVRRRTLGLLMGALLLPTLTVVLTGHPLHLSLADDLLIFLTVVVAVAVVGGFWPAVASAVASSLLLNWYFTRPFHTFTIAEPDNLLALLLFVVVAISVSSVVHLAARRAQQARASQAEAEALSTLAGTVLGADDTPRAVLGYLAAALGVGVELLEQTGDRWVRLVAIGDLEQQPRSVHDVRHDLRLSLHGPIAPTAHRLVAAAGGQAAAALDRDRWRTQAAQAEALAAGNRMRTALLAAVSHDLRTPLASIKASVSSLRQTDVEWSPADQAALLANVEEGTDRLEELIANLLDMSRLHTGVLQPFLRAVAVDEVLPLAVHTVPEGRRTRLEVPETLPLVLTDAGLLERAIANLLSNALRYSSQDQPPALVAAADSGEVRIAVIDHGPGVPAADRERIFAPFQRLGDQDPTTGVGLGLAVARGFVELVGGRLTASETAGGGLTMTIAVPVARESERVQA